MSVQAIVDGRRGAAELGPAFDEARAVEVVHDLVVTPSVSANERRAVVVFARHAADLGFEVEIDCAGNALARRSGLSSGAAPIEVVLLGHIDTVPGDLPAYIDDEGVLHGRGSVDAKGPLAAMLVAAARAALPTGVRVTVAAAVGEESPDSPGATHLATALRPQACIIGEPSGWDGVTLGYKGRVLFHAEVRRDAAHSAGPGLSAADVLHEYWNGVRREMAMLNDERTGAFETIQATLRETRTRSDGVRDFAALVASVRLPEWIGPSEMCGRLTRAGEDRGVRVSFHGEQAAHVSGRNDAVARALSIAIREEGGSPKPKRKTGTSDMNLVGPLWRCPIAAYGPGDSSLDHTPEERLSLDEYLRSIRVLTRAIEMLSAELRG